MGALFQHHLQLEFNSLAPVETVCEYYITSICSYEAQMDSILYQLSFD